MLIQHFYCFFFTLDNIYHNSLWNSYSSCKFWEYSCRLWFLTLYNINIIAHIQICICIICRLSLYLDIILWALISSLYMHNHQAQVHFFVLAQVIFGNVSVGFDFWQFVNILIIFAICMIGIFIIHLFVMSIAYH